MAPSGVGADAIINADAREWLTHGRTYSEQRFSPLDKINRDNVGGLGLAWSFDLEANRGIEATPIVHDGVLYVTGAWNMVFALDAKTGAELWRYDPEIDRSRAAYACCDIVNRGVALWGGKIYTGTIDGRLIAIDAKSGKEVWDVLTVDRGKPYTITGAPRVVKGKVIIGNGGAELGVRGYVSAYDAVTGDIVWRFYTVPGDPKNAPENDAMRMALATWNGEWWKAGGGGTVWDSMAYDPELDLLYIGVGNGSPWNQALRSPGGGDNLYLASIVALRPDTGEYVWHYQTTPGETWDYTATQHMILSDISVAGAPRKVIMQAPKNGFFYVIDRATGELLSANTYVPINWATHVDLETGRPVEVPAARWPGKGPHFQLPGTIGGHNWQPMSFSPQTGLVYIPAQETPMVYGDESAYEQKAGVWNVGASFILASFPTDEAQAAAVKAMIKGRLIAWDPEKQAPRWTVEHKGPWNGGVLSTAGGLVFQGTADAQFAAYDAATGEALWRQPTQTGVIAAPIAYEIDGEEYVAVAAGWGGVYALAFGGLAPPGSQSTVGRVLVYKLGGTASLPPIDAAAFDRPAPPDVTASPEVLAAGAAAYAQRCLVCHGDHARSYGALPDLRYSPALAAAAEWRAIVIDGSLSTRGMAGFATAFDPDTAEAIRAYVAAEAANSR
ncbi:MAG: PQQ-dependent dehydrogenase, methanol/ethanol family [Parvularculaceae bacterium]